MPIDLLNESVLRAALGRRADTWQISVPTSCPSTNTLAKELAMDDPNQKALIVAHRQTAGRGRMGRNFLSPDGAGIYCSLLFPSTKNLSDSLGITCAASVAVMRAIRAKTGLQTQIKWVNDLLLDQKKVCGILTEAVTMGDRTALILGIGINLRPMDFPRELESIATTLGQDTLSRAALIAEIVAQLSPFLENPQDNGWLEDYRRHSCILGKEILRIENGVSRPCTACEIDGRGGLTVRYPDGSLETLQSGEISLRLRG